MTEPDVELLEPVEEAVSAETGGRTGARLLLALLALVPTVFVLDHFVHPRGSVLFVTAVLAMIPLAGFLGRATEEIAIRSTPALGGLLNATFGNAIELLIAMRLLMGGKPEAAEIVRASVVGSVLVNLLFLLGLSMVAGGLRYREQKFNNTAAGVSSSFLIMAFAAVSVPTIFAETFGKRLADKVQTLSQITSGIMAFVYLAGLLFTFRTHRHLFDTTDEMRAHRHPEWSLKKAVGVLMGTVAVVAYLAGVLEHTLDDAGHELGLSPMFVGVIVIGVITNVAENLSAMSYARKNIIDISFQIAMSSAIQVMLFVVPLLVFVGGLTGHAFDLHFTLFELACMLLPVMIINHLSTDGVCNWLEGLILIALYAIIGTAFFFVG